MQMVDQHLAEYKVYIFYGSAGPVAQEIHETRSKVTGPCTMLVIFVSNLIMVNNTIIYILSYKCNFQLDLHCLTIGDQLAFKPKRPYKSIGGIITS